MQLDLDCVHQCVHKHLRTGSPIHWFRLGEPGPEIFYGRQLDHSAAHDPERGDIDHHPDRVRPDQHNRPTAFDRRTGGRVG